MKLYGISQSKIKFYENNISFSVRHVAQINASVLEYYFFNFLPKSYIWHQVQSKYGTMGLEMFQFLSHERKFNSVRLWNNSACVCMNVWMLYEYLYPIALGHMFYYLWSVRKVFKGTFENIWKKIFSYFKWHYRLLKYFQRTTS